jgi:hypothetical protein
MKENLKSKGERTTNQEFNEEMKFPFDEDDSLLEKKLFAEGDPDWLPKTRYIQAYTKYLKITKLAKKYKGQLSSSGRIRDLLKDCLNDMEMALELKFKKRGRRKNHKWIPTTL